MQFIAILDHLKRRQSVLNVCIFYLILFILGLEVLFVHNSIFSLARASSAVGFFMFKGVYVLNPRISVISQSEN